MFYDPSSDKERPVSIPNSPLQKINQHLSLQPPLSRRGSGPAILLFLPSIAPFAPSTSLDPDPIQKWAEEGFAVAAFSSLPPNTSFPDILNDALSAFILLGDLLDQKIKFAVIVYDPTIIQSVSDAVDNDPLFVSLIAYGSLTAFTGKHPSKPTLIHTPSNGNHSPTTTDTAEIHTYPVSSPYFILPYSAEYDPGSAAIAHTRSLVFLRKHLGGPIFDIEAIWEEHTFFEFEERSVAKTMGTMVAEPYVNHVPTMTGGIGRDNLTKFYRDHFIFSNPADARLQVVSRTVGPDRVVDEFVYHITHDRTVDWLLPGVPPTGKKLSIPMLAVVNVRGDRLYNEHIWWDQATALRQAGILPTYLPYPTPEGGNWQLRLPVAGVEAANMLLDESKGKSNDMLGEGWGLVPVETTGASRA